MKVRMTCRNMWKSYWRLMCIYFGACKVGYLKVLMSLLLTNFMAVVLKIWLIKVTSRSN